LSGLNLGAKRRARLKAIAVPTRIGTRFSGRAGGGFFREKITRGRTA